MSKLPRSHPDFEYPEFTSSAECREWFSQSDAQRVNSAVIHMMYNPLVTERLSFIYRQANKPVPTIELDYQIGAVTGNLCREGIDFPNLLEYGVQTTLTNYGLQAVEAYERITTFLHTYVKSKMPVQIPFDSLHCLHIAKIVIGSEPFPYEYAPSKRG